MSFFFRHDETLSAAVCRVAGELLGGVHHLGTDEPGRDDAVHEARKRLKELRALLRLVRGNLGRYIFQKENRYYRDEARKLSAFRDRGVAVETLRDLLGADAGEEKAGNLLLSLASRDEKAGNIDVEIQAFSAALATGSSRVAGWRMVFDQDSVKSGLQRTYRDGREAFAAALKDVTDENLHEWRKRVKDLWYQVQLVRKAAPPILEPLASLLHELSDRLGNDHDLAMLQVKLKEHKDLLKELPVGNRLLRKLRRRRHQLQAEALRLGEMIYVEKPERFAARIDSYWNYWRKNEYG